MPDHTPPAFTAQQMRDLGYWLGLDRALVVGRGHQWDVADVLAVVEAWRAEHERAA